MGITDERRQLYEDMIAEVGTPRLVEIKDILPNGNKLYAMMTQENEAENHYMHIHPKLFQLAEEKGFLIPGKSTILDTSSSNSAISIALTAQKAGYKDTKIIIPRELEDKVFNYTISKIENAGGEPILPDQDIYDAGHKYVAACAKMLERMMKDGDFVLNHSRAHETLVGIEDMIARVLFENPKIYFDYFLPGVGNGATILGPASAMNKMGQNPFVIAWEPITSGLAYDMLRDKLGSENGGIIPETYPSFEQLTRLEKGQVLHNIYGVGVPDVKFPFLKAAIQGAAVFGLAFNQNGDETDNVNYDPVIDDVTLVYNDEIFNRYVAAGGSWTSLSKAVNADSVHAQLLSQGFDVGRSSAASVAVAEKIARKTEGKNFLVFFYDSNSKYK